MPTSANVGMSGKTFVPSSTVIAAGGTVTWNNSTPDVHNVVGDTYRSGELSPGESYSKVFGAPGLYDYRCTLHPGMAGQIEVQ